MCLHGDVKNISEDAREWCRKYAPKGLKGLEDENFLLSLMYPAYLRHIKEVGNITPKEIKFIKGINNELDYIVQVLRDEFGGSIAFKGGYMLTKYLGNVARQTSDVDFSIGSEELYERVKAKLVSVCNSLQRKGVIYSYKIKDTIAPKQSGGVDMYNDKGVKILGVDVGWHDISYGVERVSIDVGELNAFTVERMLSDKFSSVLSRKRFRRVKDLYDIYIITSNFDFIPSLVRVYMSYRLSLDELRDLFSKYPFSEEIIIQLGRAYDKLLVRSIYKDTYVDKPDFKVVLERFNTLVEGLMYYKESYTWDSKGRYYHE